MRVLTIRRRAATKTRGACGFWRKTRWILRGWQRGSHGKLAEINGPKMLAPTRRAAIVGQGGRFLGVRRLQVVVGELGGAVDVDGAGVGLDEVPQGPRAERKGVRQSGNPSEAGFAVRGDEGAVAG